MRCISRGGAKQNHEPRVCPGACVISRGSALREAGGSTSANWLLVFVKAPSAGQVKTRLLPVLSAEEAAGLYQGLVRGTLRAVRPLRGVRVIVAYAANDEFPDVSWVVNGHAPRRPRAQAGVPAMFLQQGRTLGDRLIHAFELAFTQGAHRVVAIGSDAPEISARWIRQAFQALRERDVVLGPARDGGYQLIGLTQPSRALFRRMPWSTARLFSRTLKAAHHLGLAVRCLSPLDDLDTPADLRRYRARRRAQG